MVTIRATCRSCGSVELLLSDIELFVYDNAPENNHYRFACPSCGHVMVWQASDEAISKLVSGGVPVQRKHIPMEMLESHPDGPMTNDDLLDLMLELDKWNHGEVSS